MLDPVSAAAMRAQLAPTDDAALAFRGRQPRPGPHGHEGFAWCAPGKSAWAPP